MKKTIALITVFSLIFCIFAFAGCSKKDDDDKKSGENNSQSSENNSYVPSDAKNPTAEIKIKDYGTIVVELYADKAPNTVNNFISLASKGFYNGLIFHRVIENFMIQGGDPTGTGFSGPGYAIKGEFSANGFSKNDIKHTRGVISMARSTSPDSAGSQFFICQKAASNLDGQYAAFGMVLSGIEIVDKIVAVETDANDKPLKDVVIESITVDTHGEIFNAPETIAE